MFEFRHCIESDLRFLLTDWLWGYGMVSNDMLLQRETHIQCMRTSRHGNAFRVNGILRESTVVQSTVVRGLDFFVITKKLRNRRSICQTVVTMALTKVYSNDSNGNSFFRTHERKDTYRSSLSWIYGCWTLFYKVFWCGIAVTQAAVWCWTVDRQEFRASLAITVTS